MKGIRPTANEHHWPRHRVQSVEARKRDLIVRVSDWSKDKEEPAFDVELYIGGVYDWNESETFTFRQYGATTAKRAAVRYAQDQIAKLF